MNSPDLFTIVQKKGFMNFFSVTSRSLMKYHSPPLFSITQHHEKLWDTPTPMCDVIVEQLLKYEMKYIKLTPNFHFITFYDWLRLTSKCWGVGVGEGKGGGGIIFYL